MDLTYQTASNAGGEGGVGSGIWGLLWKLAIVPLINHSADPLVVVGHFGVNAQLVLHATAFTPGHQADQEPGITVQSDHWSATVPLAGVHPPSKNSSAEDIVWDVVGHLLGTDAAVNQRDLDDIKCWAVLVTVHVLFAPAGHHREGAIEVEHTFSHPATWQANGDDVVCEFDGML